MPASNSSNDNGGEEQAAAAAASGAAAPRPHYLPREVCLRFQRRIAEATTVDEITALEQEILLLEARYPNSRVPSVEELLHASGPRRLPGEERR